MASLTLPESTSTSPRARPSPTPTQLNGRKMVYGRRTGRTPPGQNTRPPTSGNRTTTAAVGSRVRALRRGPPVGRLEDHGRAEVRHLLQPTRPVGDDRGVARGGNDPFVGGEQVVGVRVEVRDPADHGRAGNEMVAVAAASSSGRRLGSRPRRTCRGDGRRMTSDRPVLGKVVDPDHVVAARSSSSTT